MFNKTLIILSLFLFSSCSENPKEKEKALSCSELLDQFHNNKYSTQFIVNSCAGYDKEKNIPGYKSTVYIAGNTIACTGVAIAENTILTAAHCLYIKEDNGKYRKALEKEIFVFNEKPSDNIAYPKNRVKKMYIHDIYNPSNNDNIPFADIASIKNVKLVVWVRSNVVAHAIGLWRQKQMKTLCHTNNVDAKEALKCSLPEKGAISLDDFESNLKLATVFHAINLGVAYAKWRPNCRPNAMISAQVYDLFYEAMMRDKKAALAKLLSWLGHSELIGSIPVSLASTS